MKKYAEMIASMSTDFLMGSLDEKTYKLNLKNALESMGGNYDSAQDTLLHIKRVNELLLTFCQEMMRRAKVHDDSKLNDKEKLHFDIATPKLKALTYGSDEYKQALADLKPALDHHYANNSHHPEHYENGIYGMSLFDVVEMFFDWKAASERHANGDIYKSIEHNKGRFSMGGQLAAIFKNTCDFLGYNEPKNSYEHE